MNAVTGTADGRDTRWDSHRAQRRRAIVRSTLRAIRAHGAAVGMDEIAATAGTSKTVIYRYFGDRAGLYVAVVEWVHGYIQGKVTGPLASSTIASRQLVREVADAYLALVQRDPEIYRFVLSRPATGAQIADPVTPLTGRLGDQVGEVLAERLASQGLDPAPARTWGHGVTGFIWAVAEHWLANGMQTPRAQLVDHVGALFDQALAPASPLSPVTTDTRSL